MKRKSMSKCYLGTALSLFLLTILLFSSCASKKDLIYFQPDSVELNSYFELNAPKLQPGDLLSITIAARDTRATEVFNQMNSAQMRAAGNDQSLRPTYAIDVDGNIDFPTLGKIKLSGLTRTGAINVLRKELSKYVIDPSISLNVTNFRITVLGEVKVPGTFSVDNDRITLLEALGRAGDLTINGVRKNVLVIREQNGKKQEYRVDLTKRDALNSPAYYLAQNDVIYVEPNGARIQSSKYTQNTSIFVSVASVIITVISVLTRP